MNGDQESRFQCITIDAAQGQEADSVIILLTNPTLTPFLCDPWRANVALTRFSAKMAISAPPGTRAKTTSATLTPKRWLIACVTAAQYASRH